MRGQVTVDLGYGVATVVVAGRHEGSWSGVTRRGTEAVLGAWGWVFVPGSVWVVAPAENGFVRDVMKGS